MISFSCPNCKTTYRFQDSRAGDQIACSKCKYPVRIPPPSESAPPATKVSPSEIVAPKPPAPRPSPPSMARPAPPPVRNAVAPPAPPAPPPPAPPPVRSAVAPPIPPLAPPVRSAVAPPPTPPPVPAPKPPGFKPLPPSLAKPASHLPGAPRWYYEDGLDIVGPVPEAALRDAAESDMLFPDSRVWSESLDGWTPVIEVFPQLFDGLANRPRADRQTKLAIGLAVGAVVSLLTFAVVAVVKG